MEKSEQFSHIKRTQALKILFFCLVILYVALVSFSLVFQSYFHKIWFSVALFFLGSYLVTKAIFFHFDSAMLFGLLAIFIGILSGTFFFISSEFMLEFYLLAVSFSFLIVYFIFCQNFYIILFALLFLEVLLLVIFQLYQDVMLFWVFQSLYFLVIMFVLVSQTIYLKER